VNDTALSDDFAVASGQDPFHTGAVMVWNAKTGAPLAYLRVPGGNPSIVTQVALVPSRHLLVADSSSGEFVAWSTRTWDLVGNVYVGPTGGFSVDPSEATVLLTGFSSSDEASVPVQDVHGDFLIVSLKSLTIVKRVPHGDVVHSVYSPNGRELATVGQDRQLRIYSPSTLRQVGPAVSLEGGYPVDVAWRPGSRELAVTTFGGMTLVIDVGQRDLAIPPLVDPNGYQPIDLAWDPVGDLLAVDSSVGANSDVFDGRTDFWNVDTNTWDSEMCAIAGSGLASSEWERYVGREPPYQRLCAGSG
jgi:hypothetical protein